MRVRLHYVDTLTGEVNEQVVNAASFTSFGIGRALSDADFAESGCHPPYTFLAFHLNGPDEAGIVIRFDEQASMGAYLIAGIAYAEGR